jgi:hypothetical protein
LLPKYVGICLLQGRGLLGKDGAGAMQLEVMVHSTSRSNHIASSFEALRSKISANGRPKNLEDQGMSLHTQSFQSKGWQEEKMMWRALLSSVAPKVHNF